jgi:prepilin-type N-terminal cleavage/methylation domain-containing protein
MKVKAFSFLEVLVAIVISGIVISTVYSVYVFTYKQYFKYSVIKTNMRNYVEFTSTLNTDFENAKKVLKNSDYEIEMQLNERLINYQFNNDYVLRTVNLKSDTFLLATENMQITVLNEFGNEPLISYLKLGVKDNVLAFYKDYGAIAKIEE